MLTILPLSAKQVKSLLNWLSTCWHPCLLCPLSAFDGLEIYLIFSLLHRECFTPTSSWIQGLELGKTNFNDFFSFINNYYFQHFHVTLRWQEAMLEMANITGYRLERKTLITSRKTYMDKTHQCMLPIIVLF